MKQAAPNVRIPGGTLDQIVLEVRVLRADYPTSVEVVVRRRGLLEHVGSDANAGAVTSRHPERQIRTFEVELVLRLRGSFVSTVLVVGVQHSGEIDWNRDDSGLRGRWRLGRPGRVRWRRS